jgi:hypothetical protein
MVFLEEQDDEDHKQAIKYKANQQPSYTMHRQ